MFFAQLFSYEALPVQFTGKRSDFGRRQILSKGKKRRNEVGPGSVSSKRLEDIVEKADVNGTRCRQHNVLK